MLRASRLLVAAGIAWTVLAGLAAGDGAARRTAALADDYRIIITSNRDGKTRPYSILSNGSGLAPLLAGGRRLMPVAVSRNGETVAFSGDGDLQDPSGPIWTSRTDGTGLRRLVKGNPSGPTLSPNGTLVAFSHESGGISVVRADGRGRRRVLSPRSCCPADWSPNGKALLVDEGEALLVLPLHGRRRVILRTGPIEDVTIGNEQTMAQWSPTGRWIAFLNVEDEVRRNGLYLVRPNGKRLHRIVPGPVTTVAWSPDGTRLAFTKEDERVGVIGVDGRRHIRVRRLRAYERPAWAPDGRTFAVTGRAGDDSTQVWLANKDGRILRRVTSEGESSMVGWTRRKPSLLLSLDDGRSRTLRPGAGPVFADLEPQGLYYSYSTQDGSGRVVFVPRSQLFAA
jgi:Tol biopolymer transport system component